MRAVIYLYIDGVDDDRDDYDENEDEEFITTHLRTERKGLTPIEEVEEELFDSDEQEQQQQQQEEEEEQSPSSRSAAESQQPKQSHRRSILVDMDESYHHYDEKEDDIDEDLDESCIGDIHIGDSTAETRNDVAIAEDDSDEQNEDHHREVDEQKSSTVDELEGTQSKQEKAYIMAPKSYAFSVTEEERKELQSTMLDAFAMVTGDKPWLSTAADGVSSDTGAYVDDDKKDLKAKRIAVAALNLLGPPSQGLLLKWSAQGVSPIDRLQQLEETLGHLVDKSTVASAAGTDTVMDNSTCIQSLNATAKVSPIRLPSPTASLKRGEPALAMVSSPHNKTISSDTISPSVKHPLSSDRKTPSYMKPTKSKNFHNSTIELSPI